MKLLVFLHGTIIMHAAGGTVSREERVQQVRLRDASVLDYAAYVPISEAVEKLRAWAQQGADITYFSSHRNAEHVAQDNSVLQRYSFPIGPTVFRQPDETYQEVAERLRPDVLIEDDCESIGGAAQMISLHLSAEAREAIHCIVVQEFAGIDQLPDQLTMLLRWHD